MSRVYPSSTLPPPSATGYSFEVVPICERVRMDSGRYRQTRKRTSQFHRVNLSWDLTDAELELWKDWYNDNIDNGGSSFQISLAFGSGLQTVYARFADTGYRVTMTDLFEWNVSATLVCESIEEIDTQGELETAGAVLGLSGSDWLGVLPNYRTSYGFTVESQNIQSEMDGGAIQRRTRNRRNVYIAGVEWLLTDAQMEYFKGWHRVILEFGCKPFDIDLTFGDGFQTNSAIMSDGAFSASYVAGADNWIVTTELICEKQEGQPYVLGGRLDLSQATYRTSDGEATASSGGTLNLAAATYRTSDSNGATASEGGELNLSSATYNSGT